MSENYLVINGKKAELTEEQLKALGIKVKKNPFAKVGKMERYMFIDADGSVTSATGDGIGFGNKLYSVTNYFNDEYFANQIALHQLLNRKLLKFAWDNGYEDTQEWGGYNFHWCIYYNYNNKRLEAGPWGNYKQRDVYFSSREGAKRAIKEVVEPFVKEHPEFKW